MLLYQVVLGGDQHRSAKSIQVCVVQLVGHAINFVRCVHVDVSVRQDRDMDKLTPNTANISSLLGIS